MRTHPTQERGAHQVVVWRRERLVRAGLPGPLAARLAKEGGYDLHALIELLERGCSAELALRILAPVDSGDDT